jgi:hypothetical protein
MKTESPQQAELILNVLLEWIGRLEAKRLHYILDYTEELEYFILIAFTNRYHKAMLGEWKFDKKKQLKPKTIKLNAFEKNVLIKYGVVSSMKVELSKGMLEELKRCNQYSKQVEGSRAVNS